MWGDENLAELEDSLKRLAIPGRVPARVRVAIRRRRHLRILLTCILLCAATGAVFVSVDYMTADGVSMAQTPWAVVALVFGAVAIPVMTLRSSLGGREAPQARLSFRQVGVVFGARRYALVMEIAEAITACAEAHRAGGERLAPELRKVSRRIGAVSRGISAAHRQRRSVSLLSHRRRTLKAHERRVIAALRACEARLDSDPRPALEELGGLLLTIADRYCQARVGALLDESQLQGAVAGPDREWIRTVVWAVLTIGGVIGVSRLGLSDGAEPIVMACTAIAVAAVVWNRSVRRAFDIVGLALGP
ncbi:hypothetical protein ACFV3E_23015 [Streptomyces sp. NPDC059718]